MGFFLLVAGVGQGAGGTIIPGPYCVSNQRASLAGAIHAAAAVAGATNAHACDCDCED